MKADVGDYFYRLLHPSLTVLLVSKSSEKVNVMACSWCTPVSEDPPLIAVAVSKESLTNQLIRESREFT
ncbi:MAG: flavin reductase family protein, partial [Thermoproteota archaeon]